MEDKSLPHRLMELAERAYNSSRYTYTNFLNLSELDAFSRIEAQLKHIPHALWGGADGCERKVIQFGNNKLCGYDEEMAIACINIKPAHAKFADALTHRDFLGAIMNIGIERDAIGDIRVIANDGYVFCLLHIAPYIIEQLSKVRRTKVTCAIVHSLPETAAQTMDNVTLQVTSERLDAVLSHLYKLTRADSQELFKRGRVFVNDRLQESCSYAPKTDDIVSVRGYGRFLYNGASGMTKKGKIKVSIDKYI